MTEDRTGLPSEGRPEAAEPVPPGFLSELAAVEAELTTALADLNPPFSHLVRYQLKRVYPLLRAGVVLAAAGELTGDEQARLHRIDLGAAVEMLYLALRIHTRLLIATAGSDPDRSLLGSTILAGDYCFSRAAGLAARTDRPSVVDIFARALRRASEGHLRQMLDPEAAQFDENGELLISGVAAACELAGLTPEQCAANLRQGEHLARSLYSAASAPAMADGPATARFLDEGLTAEQCRRWQEVYRLAQRR